MTSGPTARMIWSRGFDSPSPPHHQEPLGATATWSSTVLNIKKTVKTVKGKQIMTLEIDLSQDHGPSKSGKTTTVASSGGFQWTDGLGLNINVCKRNAG